MAFQLTGYRTYTIQPGSATKKRAIQYVEMRINRLASTDTLMDLDAATGTFWTAVQADATYGAYATKAFANYQSLLPKIDMSVGISALGNNDILVQTKTASTATDFQVNNQATYPAFSPRITFGSNANPANVAITLKVSLLPNVQSVDIEL